MSDLHKQFEKSGKPVFLIDMTDLAKYYNPDYVLWIENEIIEKKCKLYCQSYKLLQEENKRLEKTIKFYRISLEHSTKAIKQNTEILKSLKG